MYGIRKGLLKFIFSGSSMRRWNDKLRPVELVEVDKQAHKMIAAWALFELNSADLSWDERQDLGIRIVEQGLFDYLYRLVITDIKPPVFYRIRENESDYRELSVWVCEELEPLLHPLDEGFWQRFRAYAFRLDRSDLAGRILAAAHQFASNWEFKLIEPLNAFDAEIPEIKTSFANALNSFSNIKGVPCLISGPDNALGRFADLCGQLRFQKRWSHTPRIPETSVMGHMFIVAV
jgi:putative hydrolase of HD superfamily